MSLSGRLETMDLPEVLQWVQLAENRPLAFVRDKTKNPPVLEGWKDCSSRSNDLTKQLGQFLLFQERSPNRSSNAPLKFTCRREPS
jgi:hypothetical protein